MKMQTMSGTSPGIITYMNLPYCKQPENLDFVVAGIPFDTLTCARGGARLGPSAIRSASVNRPYNPDLRINIMQHLTGVDFGDIPVFNGEAFKTFDSVTVHVEGFLRKGMVPVILGGDHSMAFPELRAYRNVYGRVAIVHFDSHSDTGYWDPVDPEAPSNHGTPFFDAIKEDCILTGHSIQVGMRGNLPSEHTHDFAREAGMDMITATGLHAMGINEAAGRIRQRLYGVPVFVTFDIDFLDPACAPGTGTPESGGFSTWQALELLRKSLIGMDIVGFDIACVSPLYDVSGITAMAGAAIAYEFISLLACRKAGIARYKGFGERGERDVCVNV